jgi:hypothetical protein
MTENTSGGRLKSASQAIARVTNGQSNGQPA